MATVVTDKPAVHFDEDKLRKATPFELRATSMKGVFTTPSPAADFNPHTASPSALVKAGLPWKRPEASDRPEVRAAWDKLLSRKWRPEDRIEPVFEVQKGKTHILRARPKRRAEGTDVTNAWAGAGFDTGSWTGVIGYWHVPTVSKPPEPRGTEGGWNSSSWVGLDGYFFTNDVLQAGVEQRVDSSGHATYVMWYEWFAPETPTSPSYIWQTNIPNILVKPGDEIYCSVQYINNKTAGSIYIGNATIGKYVQLTLAPPPGASFSGGSVEWIMEAPDGGEPTSSLPKFTPVTFTSALACGANSTLGNPQNANTLAIENASGKLLTSTTVGSDTATITFIG